LNLEDKIKIIGIAARPAPEKGPEFIVTILKNLVSTEKNVKLLWAGESSWRKHLENIFLKAGLGQTVTFLGHIPEIEEFYSICDVVILASKYNSIESSPSAILEPMAMGKPVVATDVGGIHEIITDSENGFLRRYGDSEGFATAIKRLLAEPELAANIGKRARQKIESEHDKEKNTKSLAEILKRYAGKGSAQ